MVPQIDYENALLSLLSPIKMASYYIQVAVYEYSLEVKVSYIILRTYFILVVRTSNITRGDYCLPAHAVIGWLQ